MNPIIPAAAAVAVAATLGATWFVTRGGSDNDAFAQCRSSQIAGGADTMARPYGEWLIVRLSVGVRRSPGQSPVSASLACFA